MKFLNSGNVVRLPLEAIEVEGRLREVRESFVQNLILMAEDTGITTPVHVRRVSGRHVLIDGAHRLEAARRMGLADIAALVVECRADEARAMEASNNLGAARMTPLQTAVFVASWKRDYYALHPERRPGVFKGNRFTTKEEVVGVKMTLTRTIAEAFGVSEATVFRALRAGETLSPAEIAALDGAPRKVSMQDLMVLGKIAEPEERAAVVARLVESATGTAARARKALRTPGRKRDPWEIEAARLGSAWAQASTRARRAFIDMHAGTLLPLIPVGYDKKART